MRRQRSGSFAPVVCNTMPRVVVDGHELGGHDQYTDSKHDQTARFHISILNLMHGA
jgi:hypothetical protein